MLFTFPVCSRFPLGCGGVFFLLVGPPVVILFLLLISGLFPVVSWVLALKSLIINGIHFSGSRRVKLWLLKGM